MHIHVLGFGAIGTLVSHYLRAALDAKHVISVIHKTPAFAFKATEVGGVKVERDGVTLVERNVLHESQNPYEDFVFRKLEMERKRRRVTTLPKDVESQLVNVPRPTQSSPIDSLIVATKAQVAIQSIKALLPRLSANSTIVLLHNGMGVYEELSQEVFRNREQRPNIVVSVNTHGAWIKETGHVVHAGIGDIQLGITSDAKGRDFEASLDTSLPREEQKLSLEDITPLLGDPMASRYISLRNTISALTSTAALNVSWRPIYDVQIAMRRKLVVNSIVNPLTALLGCKNGELLEHTAARRICRRICEESSLVFHAQWQNDLKSAVRTASSEEEEEELLNLEDERFPQELLPMALERECERVIRLTHDNVSSMLIDLRRGRDTELQYMNGYLLTLARQYHVRVLALATILDLMKMRSAIPIDMPLSLNSVL